MLRNAGLELPHTMTLRTNGGEERALLRFTRARKDTEKSFAMLKKTLKWRRESAADTCLAEPLPDAHARILAEIPGFFVGHGKGGHPVFLDHTAVVPWDKILESMGMRTFLHAQVQCLEWQSVVVYQEASRRAGRPITQVINVWDMKGLTLSSFTAKVREISAETSKIAQDNYPESLAAAYVINAPSIFSVIWAVVRQFLDPKTVAKVHILGSGPKMFAKLKEALGDDCHITKDMVCCKKADVGKEELRLGLQSGMASSQTWIKERATSGVPWWTDTSMPTPSTSIAAGRPFAATATATATSGRGGTSPVTSAALLGLGDGGGGAQLSSTSSLRTPSSLSTRSVDSDGEDMFFDAEEDAFSECGEDFGEDAVEIHFPDDHPMATPVPPGGMGGQFSALGGKCMTAIHDVMMNGVGGGEGGVASPMSESQVKLIDGSLTPSTGRRDNGPERRGVDAAEAAAVEAERLEAEKDARAAAKKKCCGCC